MLESRGTGAPLIKLGVCWGPELAGLPRLFPSGDCGAGRDFLEITSDGAVRACSFHQTALPFETAEDVLRIWDGAASLGTPSTCHGCPRGAMPAAPPRRAVRPTARAFTAFASNNSGGYTLLGSFRSSERAQEISRLLNQLSADMQRASPDDNPLVALLASAGVPADSDVGFRDDWNEHGEPPEAVAVDHQVWWYADYAVTMPAEIGHWFYAMGGRVQTVLDHAHNPLIASVSLWPDRPWSERTGVPLQPLIDALRDGPLRGPDVDARVRQGQYHYVQVLWRAPTPKRMVAVDAVARQLGFRVRLELIEAFNEDPNLDALW